MPGAWRSRMESVASGVTSRGENPVPPAHGQNPECRLYWCLIEFFDWRNSQYHVGESPVPPAHTWTKEIESSVADPDQDPPDPHVFGPPGSGSTRSGSFYYHAKIVKKT
jgi:hypothetical protein